MFVLRPYQEEIESDTREAIKQGYRAPLIQCPTGGGKTVTASKIFKGASDKGNRGLFLLPRRELVYQSEQKLQRYGVCPGIIMAGEPMHYERQIQLASFDTLHARAMKTQKIELPTAQIVGVDEAHLSVADTRKAIIGKYLGDKSIVFGLTATPARADGKALGDIYDVLVKSWSVRRMMDEGYLVECQYACPTKPDLAKVRTRGGDYVESDLDEAMDQPKLIGDIIDNWCRLASDRRTVVFCVTRKHARHVLEAYLKIGIRAEYVDGETPKRERAEIFRRVETGATQVLVNVFVATFGLDIPPLNCIVIARPTKSLVLFLQMIGRVLRPVFMDGEPDGKEMRLAAIASSIKKDALVIDHSGCVSEHGFVDDDVPWELNFEGTTSQKKVAQQKEKKAPKEIICDACKTPFKGTRFCPKCGHQMVQHGEPVPIYKADLQMVERDGKKANRSDSWDEKREFYAQALGYAIEKRYRTGFADQKYREKYGVWPNDPRVRNATASGNRNLIHGWIAHMAMRRRHSA
jgi:superfamily II DNA or RNA helicase